MDGTFNEKRVNLLLCIMHESFIEFLISFCLNKEKTTWYDTNHDTTHSRLKLDEINILYKFYCLITT